MRSHGPTKAPQRRWAVWLIGFGILSALVFTVILGRQVLVDLEQQRSARSDNVQWTLTQVEVEYLNLHNIVSRYRTVPNQPDPPSDDTMLASVREEFDVFFSRVDTLRNSRPFANLRNNPGFAAPKERILVFLDATVPFIDATDAALSAHMPQLQADIEAIKQDVRALNVAGLDYFARQSDARRLKTSATLSQLAGLSAFLLIALAGLSLYLLSVNREIRCRSRELRQTNQRMNTVLSTSLDAVIVVNAKGQVITFNPAAEAIFGHREEDVKGKSIGDLIVPDHLRAAHNDGMDRMQRGGERHVVGQGRVQLEALRACGEVFPVELALQSATDGDEEIIIGFIRDISRRAADEKELISARDRALAGQKAKDEFLTVMSHEIRTPLNGILGNLSLLGGTGLTDEQSQFARNMEISGQVLLNHVNSVLDLARFEAGKLVVAQSEVNLSDLMQEIVDGQSGSATAGGNRLTWRWVGAAHPWVSADAQRLRQILLNLVGNAIKFTKGGQITLELEMHPQDEAAAPADYEFRVIDTGVGIAPENAEKIFDDFHTQDVSLDRAEGGTGLGLGIARRFTEAMGGEIGVESEPGHGSVFWVHVPLVHVASPTSKADATQDSVNIEPLDILVVEDNEINLQVVSTMLEKENHRVTVARNGQLGVDAACAHRFDVILMDISMPVMDGLTATRHIRQSDGASSQAPIVAVSANVLSDAVARFRKAGMTAFVGKPITRDALQKALRVTLEDGWPGACDDAPPSPMDEMRSDLGEEAYFRLQERYVSETDALVKGLRRAAWRQSGNTACAADCHRIAGSAALFDAPDLRDILIHIENALLQNDHAQVELLAHRIKGVWDQTRKILPQQT